MTYEEQAIRDRLDEVARSTPPVRFGPPDLIRRGRRQRRRRSGLAIGATVAALALVVAVPAVALRDRGTAGIGTLTADGPAPAPDPTATGASTPDRGSTGPGIPVSVDGQRIPGPIPGVSATRAQAIARGCGQAFGGDIGHVNPTPEPGGTQGPLVRDAVRLFNVVTDGSGSHALLYGPGVMLSCDFSGTAYNSGGSSGGYPAEAQWLPGPVAVDLQLGDRTGQTVAGRATSAVTAVLVRASGGTARVTPVNGTYLVRLSGPGSADGSGDSLVTAYGRGGRVLGTADGVHGDCYTEPGGTVVIHGPGADRNCRPATPWR